MTEREAIANIEYARKWCGSESDFSDEALDMAVSAQKKQEADGCSGCAFYDKEEWEMPCVKCKRNCKDYWRAKG